MKRYAVAILLGAVGWSGAASVAAAPDGVFSARLGWEAAARAGDDSARWSLAWAYAEQGEWARAWRWIEGEAPGADSDRAYLKAWVAWKSGRAVAVESLLDGACGEGRCWQLRVNAYWDMAQWGLAQSAAMEWLAARRAPESLRYALTSSLLNGDLDAFDRLIAVGDWRDDPAFAGSQDLVRALIKLRANL